MRRGARRLRIVCCVAATLACPHVFAAGTAAKPDRPTDLAKAPVSLEVRRLEQHVTKSHDNDGMPYVIIDKVDAKVYVFDAAGHVLGVAPALLGMARGDVSVKGIGNWKMSAIRPADRITPAGRFVAALGRAPGGEDILWVDYADAVALHRVVKGTPAERRAQRLASPTSADNRITYGCINVPVKFYDTVVRPAFVHSSGIVYILPEAGAPTRADRESPGA
jgi:hypothetical protein